MLLYFNRGHPRMFVRVVKEMDLKSIVPCTRRFEPYSIRNFCLNQQDDCFFSFPVIRYRSCWNVPLSFLQIKHEKEKASKNR
jgi:hypothetical protein